MLHRYRKFERQPLNAGFKFREFVPYNCREELQNGRNFWYAVERISKPISIEKLIEMGICFDSIDTESDEESKSKKKKMRINNMYQQ